MRFGLQSPAAVHVAKGSDFRAVLGRMDGQAYLASLENDLAERKEAFTLRGLAGAGRRSSGLCR